MLNPIFQFYFLFYRIAASFFQCPFVYIEMFKRVIANKLLQPLSVFLSKMFIAGFVEYFT